MKKREMLTLSDHMTFLRGPCCLSFGILSLHFLLCLSSFCVLFRPLPMSLDFPFLIVLSVSPTFIYVKAWREISC